MTTSFRVSGVPIWITYLTAFFAVFSTSLGLLGLIDPATVMNYLDGADNLALAWAGRNAGIGLAMAIAFYLRSAAAYAAVYVAATFREIGDAFGIFAGDINLVGIIGIGLFLALDIGIFVVCFRSALRARNQ